MSRTPGQVLDDVRRMIAGSGPGFSGPFAPGGVLRYPFAPPGTPAELTGRDAIREFYAAAEPIKAMVDSTGVEVLVRQTDDPEVVVAEFSHHGWSWAINEQCSFRVLAGALTG